MPELLTHPDVADLHRLVALYGHVLDGREWHRLGELFTDDIVFVPYQSDAEQLTSLSRLVSLWHAPDFPHPSGHHATNVLVDTSEGGVVDVVWKGISVHRNGQARSLIYRARARATGDGWRIFWLRVEQRPTHVDPVSASV